MFGLGSPAGKFGGSTRPTGLTPGLALLAACSAATSMSLTLTSRLAGLPHRSPAVNLSDSAIASGGGILKTPATPGRGSSAFSPSVLRYDALIETGSGLAS